jgi:hypothetical protein
MSIALASRGLGSGHRHLVDLLHLFHAAVMAPCQPPFPLPAHPMV